MNSNLLFHEVCYVLRLNQGKYYVGRTKYVQKRLSDHFTGKGSLWTKLYKPVSVVDLRPLTYSSQENDTTKVMMKIHGVVNVRGGKWYLPELKEEPVLEEHIDVNLSIENNLKRLQERRINKEYKMVNFPYMIYSINFNGKHYIYDAPLRTEHLSLQSELVSECCVDQNDVKREVDKYIKRFNLKKENVVDCVLYSTLTR